MLTRSRVTAALTAALIAIAALIAVGGRLTPAAAEPQRLVATAGTVRTNDWAMYNAQIATTATVVGPSSLQGRDPRLTQSWPGADLYVTADFSTTGTLTTTFQTSADGTNWTTLNQVNPQGTTVPVRIVQSADGTAYTSAVLPGNYTRPALEASDTVTVSVRIVPRDPFAEGDE